MRLHQHIATRIQVALHRLQHGGTPIFSHDWTSPHCEHWIAAVGHLADRSFDVLEIGSFEGRSALFFLETFLKSRVTCVDPFPPKRSAKFDHNIRRYRHRLTKRRGRSAAVLDQLVTEKRRYDVVYIDGDHSRGAVLADTVLAWQLLRVGGVLIWDDYLWETDAPSDMRPQHAIDAFFQSFGDCMREVHRGYQLIAIKTAEWPIHDQAMSPNTAKLKS
jgi:predicted O-methyltransferase YrrM